MTHAASLTAQHKTAPGSPPPFGLLPGEKLSAKRTDEGEQAGVGETLLHGISRADDAYTCHGGDGMEREKTGAVPARFHSLHLEGREKLSLTGVEDVTGFDENLIVLSTGQGDLVIRGQGLHVDRIDLEQGELLLRGHVQELSYDEPAGSRSLWARLFG